MSQGETTPFWWIAVGAGPVISTVVAAILLGRGRPPRRAPTPGFADELSHLLGWLAFIALLTLFWRGLLDLHRVIHGDAGTVRPGYLANLMLLVAASSMAVGPAVLANWAARRLIPPLNRWLKAREQGAAPPRSRFNRIGFAVYYLMLAITGLAQGVLAALEPWAR